MNLSRKWLNEFVQIDAPDRRSFFLKEKGTKKNFDRETAFRSYYIC